MDKVEVEMVTLRLPVELIHEIRIICINEELTFQEADRRGLELWKKDGKRSNPPS